MDPEEYVRVRVDSALEEVKKILGETRNPKFAADVDHKYDDKYCLVEVLTNLALAADLNALERMGFDERKLVELIKMSDGGNRSVTLRFDAKESCAFVKEQTVQVDGSTQRILEVEEKEPDGAILAHKLKSRVSTTVKKCWWKVDVKYIIFAFIGNDPEANNVRLKSRTSTCELVATGSKTSPLPSSSSRSADQAYVARGGNISVQFFHRSCM